MLPLNLYARVRFSVRNCTRDRGCSAHPVFPAPSVFEGDNQCKPRAKHVARTRYIQLSSARALERTIRYSRDSSDGIDKPRRTGCPPARGMTFCGVSASLRAQRSNPLSPDVRRDGLLRFARNDADCSALIEPISPASTRQRNSGESGGGESSGVQPVIFSSA